MFLMMVAITVFAQQEMLTFEVKGSEKSYNQVRVVNETSLENFHCRVVVLNADSTVKEIYGNYELEERGDSDSNTKSRKEDRIKQGTLLGVQFPKSFTGKLLFNVEYRNYPTFDIIVIHLMDKDGGYEDEY